MRLFSILLACAFCLGAADPPPDLLEAARKGRAKDVEGLLAKHPDLEIKDKEGRTALMLAAQNGHAPVLKLLLAAGAKPEAKDARGWNAYMLALLQPGGLIHRNHDAVLALLPQPRHFRLQVNAGWTASKAIFSSCFMRPEEMVTHVRELRPDAMAIDALQRYAVANGRGVISFIRADARGTSEQSNQAVATDADATLELMLEPGAACVQGVDRVTLRMRASLSRGSDAAPLLERAYGEGFKTGMKGQGAGNANQHAPLYEAWAKASAGAIYWDAVEALLLREW